MKGYFMAKNSFVAEVTFNHCDFLFSTRRSPEPHNKVGSLNLAERLVGFEPGTFRF